MFSAWLTLPILNFLYVEKRFTLLSRDFFEDDFRLLLEAVVDDNRLLFPDDDNLLLVDFFPPKELLRFLDDICLRSKFESDVPGGIGNDLRILAVGKSLISFVLSSLG